MKEVFLTENGEIVTREVPFRADHITPFYKIPLEAVTEFMGKSIGAIKENPIEIKELRTKNGSYFCAPRNKVEELGFLAYFEKGMRWGDEH